MMLARIIESDVCGEIGCHALSLQIVLALALIGFCARLLTDIRIWIRKSAIRRFLKEGGDESDQFVRKMEEDIRELKGDKFE